MTCWPRMATLNRPSGTFSNNTDSHPAGRTSSRLQRSFLSRALNDAGHDGLARNFGEAAPPLRRGHFAFCLQHRFEFGNPMSGIKRLPRVPAGFGTHRKSHANRPGSRTIVRDRQRCSAGTEHHEFVPAEQIWDKWPPCVQTT
jgi:hypothetical protein